MFFITATNTLILAYRQERGDHTPKYKTSKYPLLFWSPGKALWIDKSTKLWCHRSGLGNSNCRPQDTDNQNAPPTTFPRLQPLLGNSTHMRLSHSLPSIQGDNKSFSRQWNIKQRQCPPAIDWGFLRSKHSSLCFFPTCRVKSRGRQDALVMLKLKCTLESPEALIKKKNQREGHTRNQLNQNL